MMAEMRRASLRRPPTPSDDDDDYRDEDSKPKRPPPPMPSAAALTPPTLPPLVKAMSKASPEETASEVEADAMVAADVATMKAKEPTRRESLRIARLAEQRIILRRKSETAVAAVSARLAEQAHAAELAVSKTAAALRQSHDEAEEAAKDAAMKASALEAKATAAAEVRSRLERDQANEAILTAWLCVMAASLLTCGLWPSVVADGAAAVLIQHAEDEIWGGGCF